MTPPLAIVLVPGFWLGAWAWDEVAKMLRTDDRLVLPVTLPGLEPDRSDRSTVTLDDQVAAVAEAVADAERRCGGPVVLVGHSGSGRVITGAADAAPQSIAHLVFVDSGPASDGQVGAPDLAGDQAEIALPPWSELQAAGSSLDGLDEATLERFRLRAVPHPAGAAREPLRLHNSERHAIPVTLICSSFPAEQVERMAADGHPWFAELTQYASVDYLDVPTGHWPMWSKPYETAEAIAAAATAGA